MQGRNREQGGEGAVRNPGVPPNRLSLAQAGAPGIRPKKGAAHAVKPMKNEHALAKVGTRVTYIFGIMILTAEFNVNNRC